MYKNAFNVIFGTTHRTSTTKEYICQIGTTPQGSNDFALFLLVIFFIPGAVQYGPKAYYLYVLYVVAAAD